MTSEELYKVYAAWSGQLHFYVAKELHAHIDCEFFPATWTFALYSGYAQENELQVWNFATVPTLTRPAGEGKELIQLPRPEDNPSQADLDEAFRALCLAAARVLEADLGKERLPESKSLLEPPRKKHASQRKRLRNK